jgi:hypothetical protein
LTKGIAAKGLFIVIIALLEERIVVRIAIATVARDTRNCEGCHIGRDSKSVSRAHNLNGIDPTNREDLKGEGEQLHAKDSRDRTNDSAGSRIAGPAPSELSFVVLPGIVITATGRIVLNAKQKTRILRTTVGNSYVNITAATA